MAKLILKAPYYKPGHRTESGKSRGGYAEYIATREGVEILRGGMLGYIGERQGSNGLFSDEGEKINLSAISREIDEHPGNVWGMIISLKREDAERLGYNSAEQWINLLRSRRNDIAKEMHILPSNLRWYAAYHNKEKNPHVHIMIWSKEPREPFLSREGIHNLKQTFASDIFRQELTSIYKKQTEVRDALKEKYKSTIAKVVAEIKNGDHAVSPELVMKMQLLSEKLEKHKGKKVYEGRIYTHIIPEIGKIQLNKLSQNDLQQFYARLKKGGRKRFVEQYGEGLSDRMVRSCHTTCRTALEKAVVEGLISTNPAIGCKLPPKKAKEMQVLTQAEILRFLTQAKEEGYYEMFLLELTTGMRRGEIIGLKWRDLNLQTGELRITRQVVKTGASKEISVPKTKSSVRTILLPPDMVALLAELKKQTKGEWMFPSPVKNGEPRNPTAVYHRFQLILERSHCKKVRFHDLRHTFATMAIENGMDIKTLSAMIGHVSAETTLNIYSHITDTMQQQAAVKIDREIGGTNAQMPEPTPPKASEPTPTKARPEKEFVPYKGKIRKPGTGCVTMINDHLYEGRFTPTNADGKRISRNIYATTREECEAKLAVLIVEMKAEIKAEKERRKQAVSA